MNFSGVKEDKCGNEEGKVSVVKLSTCRCFFIMVMLEVVVMTMAMMMVMVKIEEDFCHFLF